MMNNLFSIFDPSMSILSLNWSAILIPLIMMISFKTKKISKWSLNVNLICTPLKKELHSLMNPFINKGMNKSLLMIFIPLFLINFIALSPYTFTPTAHMMMAFPTALSLWSGMMIFGWTNNTKHMLAHTVPTGTPNALMNFMVIIELISSIIRPITLSIRLSANMVAGHLLLSLLSNFALTSPFSTMMASPALFILSTLEMAVALIQAYVFMTLLTLYTTEIH